MQIECCLISISYLTYLLILTWYIKYLDMFNRTNNCLFNDFFFNSWF